MKPSHFQTPRMERESTFWYGGEATEFPQRRQRNGGWTVALILAILLALSLLNGSLS